MNKIKKFLKTHKKKCIALGVVLLVFVIIGIALYSVVSYLTPNTRESVYGDRCEVTENHPVDKERNSEVKKFFEGKEKAKFVKLEIKCNLIDIIMEVDDSESIANVKAIGKELLSVFSEDELKYYDLQLIVKSNAKKSETYPKIGTHHKEIDGISNDDFVW